MIVILMLWPSFMLGCTQKWVSNCVGVTNGLTRTKKE